jgi:hypothetical protein
MMCPLKKKRRVSLKSLSTLSNVAKISLTRRILKTIETVHMGGD